MQNALTKRITIVIVLFVAGFCLAASARIGLLPLQKWQYRQQTSGVQHLGSAATAANVSRSHQTKAHSSADAIWVNTSYVQQVSDPPESRWKPDQFGYFVSPTDALDIPGDLPVSDWAELPAVHLVDLYGVWRGVETNLVQLNTLGFVLLQASDDFVINSMLPELTVDDLLRPAGPGAPPLWQTATMYRSSPRVPLAVFSALQLSDADLLAAVELTSTRFYRGMRNALELQENCWLSIFQQAKSADTKYSILEARIRASINGRHPTVYDMLSRLFQTSRNADAARMAARLQYPELVSLAVEVHGVSVDLELLDAAALSADTPHAVWRVAVADGSVPGIQRTVDRVLELIREREAGFKDLGEEAIAARAARMNYSPWSVPVLAANARFADSVMHRDFQGQTILSYALMAEGKPNTPYFLVQTLMEGELTQEMIDAEVALLERNGRGDLPGLAMVEDLVAP